MKIKYLYLHLSILACFVLSVFQSKAQETAVLTPKLGFFEMNLGLDFRHAYLYQETYKAKDNTLYNPPLIDNFDNTAIGVTGRIQASILANYLNIRSGKKFRMGDILSAELTTGYISHNHTKNQDIWFAYKFDLGFGMVYSLNKNHELGLNLIFLKFSSDWLSENISGSNVSLRYRYKPFILECGIESRFTRFMGWTQNLSDRDKYPIKYFISFRKLLPKKQDIGLRAEWVSNEFYEKDTRNFSNDQILNLKIFYGLYF